MLDCLGGGSATEPFEQERHDAPQDAAHEQLAVMARCTTRMEHGGGGQVLVWLAIPYMDAAATADRDPFRRTQQRFLPDQLPFPPGASAHPGTAPRSVTASVWLPVLPDGRASHG
jgi:hypothetical protein